jgi:hypothetical protein
MKAPHATFSGVLQPDAEHVQPPGASLARMLEQQLREHFDGTGPFDNWRDVGWSLPINANGKLLEVYFAEFPAQPSWLLAIAPQGQPGLFARLLGRKPVDCAPELKNVAAVVHSVLTSVPGLTDIKWMLGGPPGKVPSLPSPSELSWSE